MSSFTSTAYNQCKHGPLYLIVNFIDVCIILLVMLIIIFFYLHLLPSDRVRKQIPGKSSHFSFYHFLIFFSFFPFFQFYGFKFCLKSFKTVVYLFVFIHKYFNNIVKNDDTVKKQKLLNNWVDCKKLIFILKEWYLINYLERRIFLNVTLNDKITSYIRYYREQNQH